MNQSSYKDNNSPIQDWEDIYKEEMPRPAHWSIAWSDLMMTMFILFLAMFVYQSSNQEFLKPETAEIIGGDTTDALNIIDEPAPFEKPQKLPFITAGELPRITNLPIKTPELPSLPQPSQAESTNNALDNLQAPQIPSMGLPIVNNSPTTQPVLGQPASIQPIIVEDEAQKKIQPKINLEITLPPLNSPLKKVEVETVVKARNIGLITPTPPVIEKTKSPIAKQNSDILQPYPLEYDKWGRLKSLKEKSFLSPKTNSPKIGDIYTSSQKMVKNNGLDKFAEINLVPEKTVRIILTGDLLFSTGESNLSLSAKNSIRELTRNIKTTPYMINIVGHTDNIPMTSGRYPSNWELSVARASSVARFLINDVGMNPNQFVVSGYASYRPIKPNNTSSNRAKNRRVEIIISKKKPLPSTDINKL
ncbi:MAG: flagellar motor protein MotB [Desulfotalea sp.]